MNVITQSNIIPFIAEKLNILRGDLETEMNWGFRVLYSVTGLNILASLYDYDDNMSGNKAERSVSMQHVKTRGLELIEGFYDLFHENVAFIDTTEEFIEEIINIYKRTGYILEKTYRFTFPPIVKITFGETKLIRGAYPWNVQNMSGLTPYDLSYNAKECLDCLQGFGIEKMKTEKWWNQLIEHCQWTSTDHLPVDVEYINYQRKNNKQYWLSQCIDVSGITMYRDNLPGDRKYGLMRIKDGKTEVCTLQPWLVNNWEYLRIAIALQIEAGYCPVAQLAQDGAIVHVKLSYLLPPNEQSFLELISWPENGELHWQRVIPICYKQNVKDMLKNLGYTVLEE